MNLEDFMKKKRDSLAKEHLPDRFSEQMLSRIREGIKVRQKKSRKVILGYAVLAAASVAILLTAGLYIAENKTETHTIAEIEEYYILIKEINQLNSAERDYTIKEDIIRSVMDLTEDETRIEEQLPEEISKEEKEEIIRKYYRKKNEGLEKLRTFLAENK